ncbi:hypothetical protein ACQSFK_11075 [Salmonella enterica]|uniref:hypothetical protein n=1 Tax=Salmonella enterica TaxID=28901 RepID=UPI003D31588F
MATLKSNALVKVLVPAVLLGAAGIGMRACTSGTPEKAATQQVPLPQLTPEQLRELGIEGDTPQDTLPGTIVIRQRKQIPVNFIRLHKIMTLCYCNPELSVKTAPDSFLVV